MGFLDRFKLEEKLLKKMRNLHDEEISEILIEDEVIDIIQPISIDKNNIVVFTNRRIIFLFKEEGISTIESVECVEVQSLVLIKNKRGLGYDTIKIIFRHKEFEIKIPRGELDILHLYKILSKKIYG